jgi:ferrochelatase
MKNIAVVLFNLGAPDRPEAVQPFLFNLFNDRAIIGLPQPLRWLIAKLAARRRDKAAQDIYARIGGSSPLLENTLVQAEALKAALGAADNVRIFPAMRYWHPFSTEVAEQVRAFGADEIILLPLYPQYSTTTTASSLRDWQEAAGRAGLTAPTRAICCYPVEAGFVSAITDLTRSAYERSRRIHRAKPPRVLFTAHGLPKRLVKRGDPYKEHVEATVAAVVAGLAIPNLDWRICYQSRVGPLEWLGPYAEAEIRRAGTERVPLVVVPIAFVSEHSETLVELDMIYRGEAVARGVPLYERVPAVGTHPEFIAGLARTIRAALARSPGICPDNGSRRCSAALTKCALAA